MLWYLSAFRYLPLFHGNYCFHIIIVFTDITSKYNNPTSVSKFQISLTLVGTDRLILRIQACQPYNQNIFHFHPCWDPDLNRWIWLLTHPIILSSTRKCTSCKLCTNNRCGKNSILIKKK